MPSSGHLDSADIHHPPRLRNNADVLIGGASFAGLAVAQRVRGYRVVLVDRAPLGEGVTSACAAPVSTVRAMGAETAIQQMHDRLVIHTPTREAIWPLPVPFCTFDYRRFCELAFARTRAQFIQASVIERIGQTVRTSTGPLSARLLVDATGWRAALMGGPGSRYASRRWMGFGIESEVESLFEPGLHFYFLPEVRDGYAWAFPVGGRVRFGVLSYRGRSKLGLALEQFMSRFHVRPLDVHGGFLASGLRSLEADGVFVVGDACGHCLPLTGEGIRTAVLGGFKCGELLCNVLDGALNRKDASSRYREFIDDSRGRFRALLWSNCALLALSLPVIGLMAQWFSRPRPLQMFMQQYLSIFADANPLMATARASDDVCPDLVEGSTPVTEVLRIERASAERRTDYHTV
jgi:flavin-dependent dehydrogenase